MHQFTSFYALYFFFITILILHTSCETKVESSISKFQVLVPDTTKNRNGKSLFSHLKKAGKQMNLHQIDTGVRGFEIRLWQISMAKPDLLIVLQKKDTIINCLSFFYNSENGSITNVESKNITKIRSIDLLIDSLKQIDFRKFISQSEIEKFNDRVADGVNYHLEISTSTYYKLLSYHCPGFYAKADSDNKKFQDILLLIDRYIRFYLPICSS